MALLFYDSFDGYASADILQKWDAGNGTVGATGTNGTNGMTFGEFSYAQKSLPAASGDTFVLGHSLTLNALLGLEEYGHQWIQLFHNATVQCYLRWDPNGFIKAFRGNNTLLGMSTVPLQSGIYKFVEAKIKLSTTVGTVEVRMDGATILSLTTQNTQNAATAAWNAFRVSCGSSGASRTCTVDNLYVLDGTGSKNTFLGPVRAMKISPSGAGTTTQFTPLSSTNHSQVSEASVDGDTSYVYSSTPGHIDTYAMGNLGVTGNIIAVQTNLVVRSAGAGAETVAPAFRVNGNPYTGATVPISTSYSNKREIFENSPDSGVAWTVSEIDGMEFGPKLVA